MSLFIGVLMKKIVCEQHLLSKRRRSAVSLILSTNFCFLFNFFYRHDFIILYIWIIMAKLRDFIFQFHFSFFNPFTSPRNTFVRNRIYILRPKCQRGVTIKGTARCRYICCCVYVTVKTGDGQSINVIQYPIIGH